MQERHSQDQTAKAVEKSTVQNCMFSKMSIETVQQKKKNLENKSLVFVIVLLNNFVDPVLF